MALTLRARVTDQRLHPPARGLGGSQRDMLDGHKEMTSFPANTLFVV